MYVCAVLAACHTSVVLMLWAFGPLLLCLSLTQIFWFFYIQLGSFHNMENIEKLGTSQTGPLQETLLCQPVSMAQLKVSQGGRTLQGSWGVRDRAPAGRQSGMVRCHSCPSIPSVPKRFILFIKKEELQRRVREGELFHHSPNGCSHHGWARLKPAASCTSLLWVAAPCPHRLWQQSLSAAFQEHSQTAGLEVESGVAGI